MNKIKSRLNSKADTSVMRPYVSPKPPPGFFLPNYTTERIVGKPKKLKIDPEADKDEIREIMARVRRPEIRRLTQTAYCYGRFIHESGAEVIQIGGKWKLFDPSGKLVRAGDSPNHAVTGHPDPVKVETAKSVVKSKGGAVRK